MNPRTPTGPAPQAGKCPISDDSDAAILGEFKKFCEVDRRLKKRTIEEHLSKLKRLQESIVKPLCELTHNDLRDYLVQFKDANPYHYSNILKALRVFFGGFLCTDIANGFKFPEYPLRPPKIPSREQLRTFYHVLKPPFDNQRKYPDSCYRSLFLLLASSGRRRNEILELKLDDIDLNRRMLIAKGGSSTKHVWVSFYNAEAEQELKKYLCMLNFDNNSCLFPSKSQVDRAFRQARDQSGIDITSQILRDWFCSEMGRLGVPDRYVDAFCGRVPRSVLARHYTDFSPERRKEIYDKAGLKVLS